jgi:D-aspartate ligase
VKMVLDNFAHGRLAVIRTLGRLGVPVYSLQESRRSPAALSRYSQEDLTWAITSPPSPDALPELLALGARVGDRPVLFATDDVAALFVARHADALRPVFRFPDQPAGLAERLSDKLELSRLCREHGIPTPKSLMPEGRDDLSRCVAELGLPLIIKSRDPLLMRERPEAISVARADDLAEVLEAYDRTEDPNKPNLMLQEYIPGTTSQSWMFNGYFDAGSECRAAFTGQKVRQFPRGTGATTLGVTHDNPRITETTATLMRRIGYRGLVDMNYRFDERDGQYKLLDVNARLGSTFRLFVDEDDLDIVRVAYLDLTGQPVPLSSMRPDRRWLVEPFDLWAYRDYHRREGLTFTRWLRSVTRVDERAWFAWDDPMPFVAMTALFAAHPAYQRAVASKRVGPGVRRAARRLWARPATPDQADPAG